MRNSPVRRPFKSSVFVTHGLQKLFQTSIVPVPRFADPSGTSLFFEPML